MVCYNTVTKLNKKIVQWMGIKFIFNYSSSVVLRPFKRFYCKTQFFFKYCSHGMVFRIKKKNLTKEGWEKEGWNYTSDCYKYTPFIETLRCVVKFVRFLLRSACILQVVFQLNFFIVTRSWIHNNESFTLIWFWGELLKFELKRAQKNQFYKYKLVLFMYNNNTTDDDGRQ